MRCAYQDVNCEQCPHYTTCGMPALVHSLEQKLLPIEKPAEHRPSAQAPAETAPTVVHTPTPRKSSRKEPVE